MTPRHFKRIMLSFFAFVIVLIVECATPLFAYVLYPFLPIISAIMVIVYMLLNTIAVWSAVTDRV